VAIPFAKLALRILGKGPQLPGAQDVMRKVTGKASLKVKAKQMEKGKVRASLTNETWAIDDRKTLRPKRRMAFATIGRMATGIVNMGLIATTGMMGHKGGPSENKMQLS
jgi:hypothetical protein